VAFLSKLIRIVSAVDADGWSECPVTVVRRSTPGGGLFVRRERSALWGGRVEEFQRVRLRLTCATRTPPAVYSRRCVQVEVLTMFSNTWQM